MNKTEKDYNIHVGDRFYRNNFSVRQGHAVPDYMRIIEIKKEYIKVKYEYRSIGTKERLLSIDNVWFASNRNPNCTAPTWIFVED